MKGLVRPFVLAVGPVTFFMAICPCPGCPGGGRANAPGHSGKCASTRQTEVKYGGYCKRCYKNYLCGRCGSAGKGR